MIETFLTVPGGLGVFLLDMVIMTGVLKSLAGDYMRSLIMRFTRNPCSGGVTDADSLIRVDTFLSEMNEQTEKFRHQVMSSVANGELTISVTNRQLDAISRCVVLVFLCIGLCTI